MLKHIALPHPGDTTGNTILTGGEHFSTREQTLTQHCHGLCNTAIGSAEASLCEYLKEFYDQTSTDSDRKKSLIFMHIVSAGSEKSQPLQR